MFVLAAAAGLALASGALTGTSAAHAAAVHARPMFDPCPCRLPACRPGCVQGVVSGGPASMIHRHIHLAAARAAITLAARAVNCPPPSAPATASSDGQPGC